MNAGFPDQTGEYKSAWTSFKTVRVYDKSQYVPSNELVSVIVTSFNYGEYLEECLNSVVSQVHRHIELVIVDDNSTDESLDIAAKWLKDNNIRFWRAALYEHLRNEGPSQGRQTGLANSHGDYIFILDADNAIYPRAVTRLHEAITLAKAEAAYSQLEIFGERSGLGLAEIWDPERLAFGNYIDVMSLVSRRAWTAVGGFSHLDFGLEDFDFWCKFVEHGFWGVFVPEILCRYRAHEKSRTTVDMEPNRTAAQTELVMRHPWLRLA
jgi:glycosyltransferase involved in cell wall biosynthesis